MASVSFILKNIISSCLQQHITKCPMPFKRLLSTSNILFKNEVVDDEIEIDDYERTSLNEEEEENEMDNIKTKIIFKEDTECSLIDKMPLIRDYNKVAVLLPWVKWGPKKRYDVSPELLLDEACALITSIPDMEVVYKESVNLAKIIKSHIFSPGTSARLVEEVNMIDCDSVFISLNYLKKNELRTLEEAFKKRVFDRYMVVLDIFRYYAVSAEARWQIGVAESPHLCRGISNNQQKLWYHAHKAELKGKLDKVSRRRKDIRLLRKKNSKDSIAVIGYTNCGKTTLIRGITSDTKIIGANRLFATLDVSSHVAVLPCGLKSYFVDTVGFIQDIPLNLIDSFRATLEDAIYADVIVYIRDLSHPNFDAQDRTVKDTLAAMPIPESTPIVVVNSKYDLLNAEERKQAGYEYDLKDSLNVSAVTGEGMFYMLRVIESKLLEATGRKKIRLRLPIGSDKVTYLKENIGIQEEEVDKTDINFCKVIVALNEKEIFAYRKHFKS